MLHDGDPALGATCWQIFIQLDVVTFLVVGGQFYHSIVQRDVTIRESVGGGGFGL